MAILRDYSSISNKVEDIIKEKYGEYLEPGSDAWVQANQYRHDYIQQLNINLNKLDGTYNPADPEAVQSRIKYEDVFPAAAKEESNYYNTQFADTINEALNGAYTGETSNNVADTVIKAETSNVSDYSAGGGSSVPYKVGETVFVNGKEYKVENVVDASHDNSYYVKLSPKEGGASVIMTSEEMMDDGTKIVIPQRTSDVVDDNSSSGVAQSDDGGMWEHHITESTPEYSSSGGSDGRHYSSREDAIKVLMSRGYTRKVAEEILDRSEANGEVFYQNGDDGKTVNELLNNDTILNNKEPVEHEPLTEVDQRTDYLLDGKHVRIVSESGDLIGLSDGTITTRSEFMNEAQVVDLREEKPENYKQAENSHFDIYQTVSVAGENEDRVASILDESVDNLYDYYQRGKDGVFDFTNDPSNNIYNHLKDINWQEKADEMLNDANTIINMFDEFASMFEGLGGELGEAFADNIDLSIEDLTALKDYIADNVEEAMYAVDQLKETLEARDELKEKYIAKKGELDLLKSPGNEPNETIPCTHKRVKKLINEPDKEYLEHPNGDPNPAHDTWAKEVAALEKEVNQLLLDLKQCQIDAMNILSSLKVYNDVVVKFKSSARWQAFTASK